MSDGIEPQQSLPKGKSPSWVMTGWVKGRPIGWLIEKMEPTHENFRTLHDMMTGAILVSDATRAQDLQRDQDIAFDRWAEHLEP